MDTSVWIDHLRRGVPRLAKALEGQEVLVHPFVIGELACGEFDNRREVLNLLSALPASAVETDDETLLFIERHRLMGKGIGYVDAHLLASVMLTGSATLWTRDKRLHAAAAGLRVEFANGS